MTCTETFIFISQFTETSGENGLTPVYNSPVGNIYPHCVLQVTWLLKLGHGVWSRTARFIDMFYFYFLQSFKISFFFILPSLTKCKSWTYVNTNVTFFFFHQNFTLFFFGSFVRKVHPVNIASTKCKCSFILLKIIFQWEVSKSYLEWMIIKFADPWARRFPLHFQGSNILRTEYHFLLLLSLLLQASQRFVR